MGREYFPISTIFVTRVVRHSSNVLQSTIGLLISAEDMTSLVLPGKPLEDRRDSLCGRTIFWSWLMEPLLRHLCTFVAEWDVHLCCDDHNRHAMFSKKHSDLQKSLVKLSDNKKDIKTRFKHLKVILGKNFFRQLCTNGKASRWVQSINNTRSTFRQRKCCRKQEDPVRRHGGGFPTLHRELYRARPVAEAER